MADKTTTLKTQTGDNVYPNVIGENRKDSFADSSTIKHYFYSDTNKVGFQLANETNTKIQNSLQKPVGLTKTELVGVGTNGQENIEIGDNLKLENGKLSATGGNNIQVIEGTLEPRTSEEFSFSLNTTPTDDCFLARLHDDNILINSLMTKNVLTFGSLTYTFYVGLMNVNGKPYVAYTGASDDGTTFNLCKQAFNFSYVHFITMTNSADGIALYLTIQNIDETVFTAETLATYLAGKKVLVNGNLHGFVPTYIAGEGGTIKVYYRAPGDSNINPDPDVFSDLSSFAISDLVTPVE